MKKGYIADLVIFTLLASLVIYTDYSLSTEKIIILLISIMVYKTIAFVVNRRLYKKEVLRKQKLKDHIRMVLEHNGGITKNNIR